MYWSKNKEKKFIKMYSRNTDEEVAKIMGVSYGFVRRKAEELGLEKDTPIKHEWTQQEVQYVIDNYENTENENLANALGISKSQIEHRAYRLNLRKSKEYMSKMVGSDNNDLVKEWTSEWNREMGCSKGHYVVGKILQHIFPFHKVVDEQSIGNLRIDWQIEQLKIAIEVHGSQHTTYNQFFHRHKNDFIKGQENDWQKSEMLESLDFSLIVIYHDEELSINLIKHKLEEVI